MNPRLPLCLLASLVGAWSTIHAQGVSEDCCLDYQRCVQPRLLRLVQGYRRQEVSGSCNLPAVIFSFRKNKVLCANPRDSWVQKMTDFLDAGNKTFSKHLWRHFHDSLFRCRKAGPGNSKLPPPKLRRPGRINKRETSFRTKTNTGGFSKYCKEMTKSGRAPSSTPVPVTCRPLQRPLQDHEPGHLQD